MHDLRNRHAIVCGGTAGIGEACAGELAGRGAAVTLVARDEQKLGAVSAALDREQGQIHHHVCVDFDQPQAVADAIREHLNKVGAVHILVNNTGGPPAGPIGSATVDAFLDAYHRHLICNHLLAQAVIPGMRDAGFGRIVNIISTSVRMPIRGLGVSNTTRAAVANWARTLATEVASMGITVNNVLPGFTDTQRLASIIKGKAEKAGVSEQQIRDEMFANIPMGRFARPEETAAAVGFLASQAASYITGVSLTVDGGRLAAQ